MNQAHPWFAPLWRTNTACGTHGRRSMERSLKVLRIWGLPLAILLLVSLALFSATHAHDLVQFKVFGGPHGHGGPRHGLDLLLRPNPSAAANTLANAGEIVAAVLALAITVVAIIVELSANRYTHRITDLFIEAPINFAVMGFFVVTALHCLWVTLTFDHQAWPQQPQAHSGFVPYTGIVVSVTMLALCLLVLLPYFAFVFAFLNPINIVERMRRQVIRSIPKPSDRLVTSHQHRAVERVEQLTDVAINAVTNKDKGVAMASADALLSIMVDYQQLRTGKLHENWFKVDEWLAHNPDFVSMSPTVLQSVSDRRVWFEMKLFRQYQTIYNDSLNLMRDINYVISINTRRIAQYAIEHQNRELLKLAVKFFNTFLRSTINAKDIRTAYNVLHQYRLLGEHAILGEHDDLAVEIGDHFKYYGVLAHNAKLPFVTETVAYDLCMLNEVAHEKRSPTRYPLLDTFLEVDRESESEAQEASLRGVRKAHIKLATYYLLHNEHDLARRVYEDMSDENLTRLVSIRDELLSVKSAEFWEMSDRGENFEYLTPQRKVKMLEFFQWFGNMTPPNPSKISSLKPN